RQSAPEYFPVTYLEPMAGNEAAVGFDLASNKVRLRTLNLSRSYRSMMATDRIRLVQETQAQFGILVFMPVFHLKPPQSSDIKPAEDLMGFALGVFKVPDLVAKAKESIQLEDSGILINLFDRSAAPENQNLYSEFDEATVKNGIYYHKLFTIAGRRWELVATADQSFLDQHYSIIPWVGLIFGIFTSFLLAGFFYIQLRTNEKIKVEVRNRVQELRNSEVKTKKILDTALNGMITINSKGIVDYLNPAGETLFQYRADEVLGKNVNMLMPEPYHAQHDQYLENYHQTGIPKIIGFNREVIGKRKNGTEFPMRLAVGEMEFGGIKTYVGVILDITEQKAAERDLIASKELAEEANRLKTDFLNTMSHELRTPLTVILGNISDLTDVDDLPDLEEIADIAGDIQKAGDHLLALINDLLDLSKIEAGKMELELHQVGTREIVGNSIDTLKILAERKGIKLVDQVMDHTVAADPIRLKQILMNLIGNAIKFTDTGEITISVEPTAKEIMFHISDTGSGITAEDQEHIFDPFRQVDSSSRRRAGGSGLGLAITKKLVELHGGQIGLKSTINQGSTFSFSLPVFQESNHEDTGR
ncbi:MAG: PAS domain S-box protein, partial [Deltaproteobacteria bacterium]|nr:PAS domain S-box protein [Deltaproteobacteria bacterium]